MLLTQHGSASTWESWGGGGPQQALKLQRGDPRSTMASKAGCSYQLASQLLPAHQALDGAVTLSPRAAAHTFSFAVLPWAHGL